MIAESFGVGAVRYKTMAETSAAPPTENAIVDAAAAP